MLPHLKTYLAVLFVAFAILRVPSARADGKNEIRAVTFEDDPGGSTTRIHVRGATTPTFTVYKLERPTRIVVDVPQAQLADAVRGHDTMAVFAPNSWAVSTVAAQQLDDGGQVVRVVITLARPGRYDVTTAGNEVVVAVSARDAAPKRASPEALAKAQAETEQAKQAAQVAQAEAAKAKDVAAAAQRTAANAQAAAATAQQAAAAQVEAAKSQKSTVHTADLDRAKQTAAAAQQAAAAAQAEAARAKQDAGKAYDTAQRAAVEADRRREASDQARKAAEADAQIARAETAKTKAETKVEIQAAKADAARARSEAEAAKAEADKLVADAKRRLATLDKTTADAHALEDRARAAAAAAQVRDEAARAEVARVRAERLAAEAAAAAARDSMAQSSSLQEAERSKRIAEQKAAEARLAAAKQATADAESARRLAEVAAATAKQDLERSRSTLARVEQQQKAAENAASEAARKRSEAEAATIAATRKRGEAEIAANDATRRRGEAERAASQAMKAKTDAEAQRASAESQRKIAEDAAQQAQVAERAADRQRVVAEQSAQLAVEAKQRAETGLAALDGKRAAAERAAAELEQRARAEAKAQADEVAAQSRRASEAEVAKLRTEVAKLADDRAHAEAELTARRAEVASQQQQTEQLKTAAAAARDAAAREEARRTQLVADQARMAKPVVVAEIAPTKPIATVKDITFKGDDRSGQVDIAVAGDASVVAGESSPTHVELVIDHAELGPKLERKLDVSRFGSPVRAVSSYRDRKTPNRVRLVAELTQPATVTFERDGGAIHWHLSSTAIANNSKKPRVLPMPSPVMSGFGATSTPLAQQTVSQVPTNGRRRIYHGATVSYDFQDASIRDLLRLIADTGHVSIIVPDSIDSKVTLKITRVPWDQALEVILATHGLWYRQTGNIYRIAPRKEIDAEDEADAARRAAAIANESPAPGVVQLNYASANDLRPKLDTMLSQKGSLQVDDRTNKLIINDVTANREAITRLALSLDTQTPQISIEARIVEARSTFLRQIGVQWGGNASSSASGGNATGLIFPSTLGVRGGSEDAQTIRAGVASPSDFAINLPAATGTGEGGAMGLTLGSVGGNLNINLRLSALEDSGTVRIISAPKITVLNNKEAKISQGVSIPISVVSASGTQTQFVQADLLLQVTPTVSQRDCAISMSLNVTKNEPDFVNVGARGDPTILRKEAHTSMLVQDGETSVLGGIYTRNSGLAYKKVPFFGDLPVIGWLFKNRRENDDRTEILVFITPKITNRALLSCQ